MKLLQHDLLEFLISYFFIAAVANELGKLLTRNNEIKLNIVEIYRYQSSGKTKNERTQHN